MFQLLRVHQYIKNLFVFAPLFFSLDYTPKNVLLVSVAFLLFSSVASSIYILNDLLDVEDDRQHPKKKNRPIASGKVSKSSAVATMLILFAVSISVSFIVDRGLFTVLLIYFVLNVAYSVRLKHISVIDIFIIATGFVLRLFAGSTVMCVDVSMWIIIMTFLLALFLAVAKRRDDVILSLQGKDTRKNIDGYNLEFVNAAMILMSGVVIVAYILYTVQAASEGRYHSEYLYLTTGFVILGIMRYMQITFVYGKSGSPTKVVLTTGSFS